MSDIADILKRMDSYRRHLPLSGNLCLDELSNAIHDLKVENDNLASALEAAMPHVETLAVGAPEARRLIVAALAAYRSAQK